MGRIDGRALPGWVGSDPARVETDRDGVVVAWNAAAEQLYGHAPRDALGRGITALVVPARQTQHAAMIMEGLALGRSWEGELEVCRRDGRVLRVLVHEAPRYDEQGELIGFVGHSVPAAGAGSFTRPVAPPSSGWRGAFEDALFDPAARAGSCLRVWLLGLGLAYEWGWALLSRWLDPYRFVGAIGAIAILGIVTVAVFDLWVGITVAVVGGVAFDVLVDYAVPPDPFALGLPVPLIWVAIASVAGVTAVRLRARARRGVDDAVSLHRELVASLVPTPGIQRLDLSVAALYRPGEQRLELGGDFYSAIERPDGSVALLVGDVSGHGPSAAALAAMLRAAWEALTEADISPQACLQGLNRMLLDHAPYEDFFATVCSVELDPTLGDATVTLAGHQPPILVHGATATPMGAPAGVPLGVSANARWGSERMSLPTAFSLLLYTDGVIEGRATPDSTPRFGEARLLDLLVDCRCHGREALEEIFASASAANGAPLADDAALLLVESDPG